jgi:hypothetical protein
LWNKWICFNLSVIYTASASFNCTSCMCNFTVFIFSFSFQLLYSCYVYCIIKSMKCRVARLTTSFFNSVFKMHMIVHMLFISICHVPPSPSSFYWRTITVTNRASPSLLKECIIFRTMMCVSWTLKIRNFFYVLQLWPSDVTTVFVPELCSIGNF